MDKELGKILIIDDDEDVLLAAKMLLKKHAQQVIIEKNPKKIPFLLNNDTYDVILLDMNFSKDITSGKEGFYWLEEILNKDPQAVVILITAFGDVEMAVKSLKEGATDFVLKSWQNEKLIATISTAAKLKESYKEVDKLKKAKKQLESDMNQPFREIIGESDAIKKIFEIIEKVAQTDANILILGENGTGKELIARAIHQRSHRSDNVFIGVDMGAITETLFESELFGHKKGSFTDAKEDRAGRFEIANGGSLFLDEIGNLSLPLQSKLLTALQNRQITRIGSNKQISIDIRLICATNMPIYEMVGENTFRQDLLYRVNTVEIHLPSLRERLDDISLLANHFIESYCHKYRKSLKKLPSATIKKLQKYHWPGNVRELQHAIERAVIMSEDTQLTPEDFFFLVQKSDSNEAVVDNYNLEEVEKNVIQKAIDRHGGNISKAAKELGLTRASLYRRLESMGFRNFKFNLILRVISLALTIYLLAYLSITSAFLVTQGLVLGLVVFQIISMINFLNKTNTEIAGFLNSIKYDDFSHTYSTQSSNSSIDLLNREFNKVIRKFREIRAEKEAQYHYLKTIVQHVGIGIITFDKKGEIQIINSAAKKLLNVTQVKNINQMRSLSEQLVDSFFELKTGGRDLVKIDQRDNNVQLAVYAIELTLSGKDFKLISLQNIQSELEEKEMEAWQNLIRVLTHEIMNSVTPISSLAAIVEQELEQLQKEQKIEQEDGSDLDDIHLAIQTIHKRSTGLIRFVSDFRNLTRIPNPKFSTYSVKEIFDQIVTLLKFELEKCNVEMQVEIDPETMQIEVDKELMEQVLINLIKNAIQALESDEDNTEKAILFRAAKTEMGETIITVRDNGPGIESEALSKIFIPFFTTKKTGSGIGLSLSKQIIRKHHGNLTVKSALNEGTEFTIKI